MIRRFALAFATISLVYSGSAVQAQMLPSRLSPSGSSLDFARPTPQVAADDLTPKRGAPSASRFAAAWVLGTAGSLAGGYVGGVLGFSEGEILRFYALVGAGSVLGSGLLAGGVNQSLGGGVLGGLVGFGAGLGAMKLATELRPEDGDGWVIPIGVIVQGLLAASGSAMMR